MVAAGPQDSPFEGGTFKLELFLPEEYPMTAQGRNGMDLTEAEDIKKRWQEYTEEPYKKDLHDPDNHNGVITHLQPDILECEVKWALENITTRRRQWQPTPVLLPGKSHGRRSLGGCSPWGCTESDTD